VVVGPAKNCISHEPLRSNLLLGYTKLADKRLQSLLAAFWNRKKVGVTVRYFTDAGGQNVVPVVRHHGQDRSTRCLSQELCGVIAR
jgi:hypothetical protein